jgi:hypothetical protein
MIPCGLGSPVSCDCVEDGRYQGETGGGKEARTNHIFGGSKFKVLSSHSESQSTAATNVGTFVSLLLAD